MSVGLVLAWLPFQMISVVVEVRLLVNELEQPLCLVRIAPLPVLQEFYRTVAVRTCNTVNVV